MSQLKEATERYVAQESLAEDLGERVTQLTGELEQMKSSSEAQVAKWKSRAQNLREAVKKGEEDVELVRKQLADLEASADQSSSEAEEKLKRSLQESSHKAEQLSCEVEELKTQRDDAQARCQDLHQQVNSARVETASFQQQLQSLEDDGMAHLREEVEETKRAMEKTKKRGAMALKKAADERDGLKLELKQLKQELEGNGTSSMKLS